MEAHIDNICNICTGISVYPWFFVNKLRVGNNIIISSLMNENSQNFAVP